MPGAQPGGPDARAASLVLPEECRTESPPAVDVEPRVVVDDCHRPPRAGGSGATPSAPQMDSPVICTTLASPTPRPGPLACGLLRNRTPSLAERGGGGGSHAGPGSSLSTGVGDGGGGGRERSASSTDASSPPPTSPRRDSVGLPLSGSDAGACGVLPRRLLLLAAPSALLPSAPALPPPPLALLLSVRCCSSPPSESWLLDCRGRSSATAAKGWRERLLPSVGRSPCSCLRKRRESRAMESE